MMMHIHYNETTGDIVAWGDGDGSEPYLPGHAVIDVGKREIDHKLHKVDPATRQVVAKTRVDLVAMFNVEIVRAVERELDFTDQFIDPPSDRPRKGPFAFDWGPYREEVRRLSKLKSVAAMIEAWPPRPGPDKVDAVRLLRERIKAAEII